MGPESTRARVVRVGVAVLVLIAVRCGLALLPLRLVRRAVDYAACRAPRLPRESAVRVAARTSRVARYVPGAACLAQALAGQVLLAWHGHPGSLVRFGVRRGEHPLTAHAWLDYQGRALIGGPDVSGYTPLDAPATLHAR